MHCRDRAILNAIQREFPLDPRPYDVLAKRLGIPSGEVRRRLASLRRRGVVRRIAPMLDRSRLGLRGVLVAAKVSEKGVRPLLPVGPKGAAHKRGLTPFSTVTRLLAGRDEVTHSYLRSGPLNLWFTVTLRGGERVDTLIRKLRALGVREVVALPTRRVFKLNATFRTEDNARG